MDIVVSTAEKTEKMTLFSLSNINCNNNDACFLMMVDFLKLFKFEATNVCRNSYFFFFFYNSIPLSELAASQTAVPAAPASLINIQAASVLSTKLHGLKCNLPAAAPGS